MRSKSKIGTSLARVKDAEEALGVTLPGPLRQALCIANRLEFECIGEWWRLLPVWDRDNPRRTASHIVHENHPEQRWPGLDEDLLIIATHFNTADLLVLRVVDGAASTELSFFDTASGSLESTDTDVYGLLDQACAYAAEVTRRMKST